MTVFHDFDAAWADAETDRQGDATPPVEVKMFGQVWELPRRMPAAVLVRGARLMEGGDRVIGDVELIGFAAELVPRAILDQWLDRGIDVEQLADVLRVLLPIYMGADTSGGDGEGEAAGPEAASGSSGRSSPAGRRSKPTSKGSTARTSTG